MRHLVAAVALIGACTSPALADPRTECPNPPATCKVLTLSAEEEKILLDERGILATAAQARSLDLGALATYFQQKIAKAPAGDAKEATKQVPPTAGSNADVGSVSGKTGDLKPATPEH